MGVTGRGRYDLPDPQAIFTLSYFRERPDAFYRLCAELWPDNFRPTPTHHFIAELNARGLLRRCFTQVPSHPIVPHRTPSHPLGPAPWHPIASLRTPLHPFAPHRATRPVA